MGSPDLSSAREDGGNVHFVLKNAMDRTLWTITFSSSLFNKLSENPLPYFGICIPPESISGSDSTESLVATSFYFYYPGGSGVSVGNQVFDKPSVDEPTETLEL